MSKGFNGPRKRRPVDRALLFPKKVQRERFLYDYQAAVMRQQMEVAFPDREERAEYVRSLLAALDEPSREHGLSPALPVVYLR